MAKQVQVHITTPTTNGEINRVDWVDESLKPKPGMVLPMKGDSRVWTVKYAYTNTVQDLK
jgi:hypothetical protein